MRAGAGNDPERAMADEAARVLRLVRPDDRIWLLERTGTELSSEELSIKISGAAQNALSRLTFVVSGTFGAATVLHERADFLWSLSRLTFLHEWARMLVLEQLYRSAKIARNEPYHH